MSFLVRNLPSGIPCQFKVCGYNNGGWGELSSESNLVIPGEDLAPTPDAQRWLRIREGLHEVRMCMRKIMFTWHVGYVCMISVAGGVLAALDQLDAHPQHRYDTIKVDCVCTIATHKYTHIHTLFITCIHIYTRTFIHTYIHTGIEVGV